MNRHSVEQQLKQEIEERKKIEKELRRSVEQYRDLVENINDVIYSVDSKGIITYIGAPVYPMIGYLPSEIIGRGFIEFIHKDDLPVIGKAFGDALRGKIPPIDIRIIKKNGDIIWVRLSGKTVNSEEHPEGLRGVFSDITERKRSEAALRESEIFARSILDGLSANIAIVDERGVIAAVNKSWRKFADENPPVMGNVCEGANYLDICDGAASEASEAAEFAGAIRSILRGSTEKFEMEYPCHSPDEQRWFVGRVTPFPDSSVPRVVVAHENISERKNAELEVQSLSRHLLSVQEEERQRVARDLHDSVGQTVLAAKLNIEAYQKNKSDRERLVKGVAFLDRASQELRSIYSGLYPSILEDLGLEAAVRWYAKHFLEANGISVSIDIALESEVSKDKAVNLYRIIQEVLSNVLKHSGADRVRLQLLEKGGVITLTVQDKGIGFDEKGMGLDKFGLINLRYRASLLGGECRIDSNEGEGTTITVTAMRAV